MGIFKVYVGKAEGYRKTTIVRRNNKWVRYIKGESRMQLLVGSTLNPNIYELTDIETEEDLETHLLSQRILGG
jgi:predicted Ser/Thr protein kinase